MRVLPVLLLVLIAIGCGHQNKKENYHDVIQGNWETHTVSFKKDTVPVTLFIVDNIIHYGNFQRNDFFQLNGDRVVSDILLKDSSITRNVDLFKIISATNNQLVIVTKSQYLSDEFHCKKNDTLKFTRAPKRNNLKIKRVSFYCSGCFGTCPSFKMEMNPDGTVKYDGYHYVQRVGLYEGQSSPEFWEFLIEKAKYIDFSNWKEKYEAPWTDDQSCSLVFETNKGIFRTYIYGDYKEPIALRDIAEYIYSNYGSFDLAKSNKMKLEFKHEKELQQMGILSEEKVLQFVPPVK